MTDDQKLKRLFRATHAVMKREIEDIVGELSAEQRAEVVGVMAGLVMAVVDDWHPRPDGRQWKDVFEEACAKG